MLKKSSVTRVLPLLLVCCGFAAGIEASRNTFKEPATAAGSDLYKQGVAAVQANQFAQALPLFEKANQAEKNNPDVLNMLAYTQRKLGKTQDALNNYYRALALRPNFPQAREYLGEAYLQAALEELDKLQHAGAEGQKQADLLKRALHDAASKAGPAAKTAAAKPNTW